MTYRNRCLIDYSWPIRHRTLQRSIYCLSVVAVLVFSSRSIAAPSCTVSSVASVSFGAYDVFTTLPNNNGIGSITIRCTGGGRANIVMLSTGQSNSYASRVMKSGANLLNYNLYTSAARNVVWGDGTGGSSTMSAAANRSTTLNIFGRIPARQDAAVGTYTDSITATVNF